VSGPQRTNELLSSAEVARRLGVSAASVKRWADAGALPCVRTAGHHRRFAPEAVDQFRAAQEEAATVSAPATPGRRDASAWVDELLTPLPPLALEASLLGARAELGSWWRVCERLGPSLAELGRRWSRGEISVTDEHRASERLSRALSRVGDWMPTAHDGPRCMLAAAEGDEHTLGLSLVEVCLREHGWTPIWIGRSAPSADVVAAIDGSGAQLVALSASASSRDGAELAHQAERIGEACRRVGADLILGGSGAWPERPAFGRIVRDFATLTQLLAAYSRV
jgi:MerR family transcriptional regulator, light-induced transcriptional regulator